MKEVIKVDKLCKSFKISTKQQKLTGEIDRKKIAVNNVSFSVYEGEVFGLLGPNGAGKTTTLRMLSTLIAPDKGDALVEGKSILANPSDIRKKIGFLTSDLQLDGFFSPNYLYDFFSDLYDVDVQERDKRKRELFSLFGIDSYAETKVCKLSTGMKQKVSLVISLVNNPNIIIFDEPTNGLDIVAAKMVTDFLLELKKQGKTIIISTHIFSLIEKLCDKVGIMLDGKLLYCEELKEITKENSLEDKFFEIYNNQCNEVHT